MKRIVVDFDAQLVSVSDGQHERQHPFASPEAFAIVSEAWLRIGWDVKYVYTFSWLGRPIIQLPEDLLRVQEVVYRVRPDVIVETGVAHGGSLVFWATLCRAMNRGRVIGVDVEIRPANRLAIEAHELSDLISLVEGDSVAPETIARVRRLLQPGETVFVLLDSNHTKEHVLAELNGYGPLVSPGSYLVAADGIMESLVGAPRAGEDWRWNNPKQAAQEFVRDRPEFCIEEPPFLFNEGLVNERVTYWPSAFIRRLR